MTHAHSRGFATYKLRATFIVVFLVVASACDTGPPSHPAEFIPILVRHFQRERHRFNIAVEKFENLNRDKVSVGTVTTDHDPRVIELLALLKGLRVTAIRRDAWVREDLKDALDILITSSVYAGIHNRRRATLVCDYSYVYSDATPIELCSEHSTYSAQEPYGCFHKLESNWYLSHLCNWQMGT